MGKCTKKVYFENCGLTEVPKGLKNLFPNLTALRIEKSNIKTISRTDFEEYKGLKEFVCTDCPVEYLPGDLFQDVKFIEFIVIGGHDLKFIEPNILDRLCFLKHVEFSSNFKCYSIYPQYNPNATLQGIKTNLLEKLFKNYKSALDLKISEGIKQEKDILLQNKAKSDQLVKELEVSEVKLKNQLKQLQESEKYLNHKVQDLKISNDNYVKDIGQQKHINNLLQQNITSLDTKIKNLRTENQQLKVHGDRIKQEIQELKENKVKSDREIQKLKEPQTKLTQQVQQLKKSESKLKLENDELRSSKSKIQNQLQESINYEKQQNIQIEQLKTIERKLTEKNQQLEKMKASLAYDLTSFTQNETTRDFKIIIEGQEFPVHKFLLAARSPTLAEILKNNPEVENLNLVDISVEIFEIILKFLYTDEHPGDKGTNFMQLFAAAGKLKIEKLVKYAAPKIINQVDGENALEILRVSACFKLFDLKLKTFKLLKKKFSEIKFEDEWLENPDKLIKVVTMLKKKEEALKKFEKEFKEVTEIK